MKNFRTLMVFLFIFFFLLEQLSAGWFIVEKREDKFGNFSMQSVFIQGQKVRIESATSTFIFNLETQLLTIVFPKQLVYYTGHYDTIKNELFRSIETQITVMIQQMPERERDILQMEFDSVMHTMRSTEPDSLLPENFKIVETDSILTINTFKSKKYVFTVNDSVVEELWITNDVKPYSSIQLKDLNKMMRIFSKPSIVSICRESNEWLSLLQNGLVMQSVIPTPLGKSVMKVEFVRDAKIPDLFFEPPSNYRGIGTTEVVGIIMGEEGPIKPDYGDETNPLAPKKPVSPLKSKQNYDDY